MQIHEVVYLLLPPYEILIYMQCMLYAIVTQEVPLHQKLHPHQPVRLLHPESQCRLH